MAERSYKTEDRIDRVRLIAARFIKLSEGESVREVMHALALATGSLIHNCYRSAQARDVAVEHQVNSIREHAKNA
jgi:hypothetical protein